MSSNNGCGYLGVSVHFEPRKLTIAFQNEFQAIKSYTLVKDRSFTKDMNLDPSQHRRYVSLRLPSRVTDIVASTACGGFYLHFCDVDVAKGWHKTLLLWKFVDGSSTDLYLARDISQWYLRHILGMEPDVPPPNMVPGKADDSKTNTNC
ncbi:Uu.00g115910.m01.CDS01 [Anthostomella pinea]|uniref:Uu.00g115910.m01.CDS01 n=1 Tax=Anthostomella pinea TaxID=933095 RepID=A0AAI8VG00_9PEZI|nr:Uu.00g115910.m01.CDS01 [Anthostomella pinea]